MKQLFNTSHVSRVAGVILLLTCCVQLIAQQTGSTARPNIIFILADDMGYGDLSCYGQQHFETPNIDRLAREGMQFMQHYSGTAVCAPSRSVLMTGQHTGYTPIRGNRTGDGKVGFLPDATFTLAEMLQAKGYATGAFGKWGLGPVGSEGDPNKQGFDEFYGYNSQSLAHNYFPDFLWHNSQKVVLKENMPDKKTTYSPDLIQQQALAFIDSNRDRPFFLFYPTIIPHAELVAPEAYMNKFRGKLLPEKSYKGAQYGDRNFRKGGYESQPEGHAAFAAMINLLDDQIGQILNRLKQYGLDSNTIVIFSSDNGPHLEGGADPDYFNSNGPFRGYKRDLYEGGIREPMLVRWPGHIQPASRTNLMSAFWDMMPTVADLLKIDRPEQLQGVSLLPTWLGQTGQQQHEYLYWEFHEKGGRQAIRKGAWKLVVYNVLHPEKRKIQLFNIDEDPGEKTDLAAHYPDKLRELESLMRASRIPSPRYPFVETVK
ncbi:arylsulfatase [Niabella terrae]